MLFKSRKKPVVKRATEIVPVSGSPKLGFDYEIRLSKRRTTAIHVKNEHVTIAAPFRSDINELHKWINQKQRWVLKKLEEQKQTRKEKPEWQFCEGEIWPFMGKELLLQFELAKHKTETANNDSILLRFRNEYESSNKEKVRSLVIKWYKQQAKDYLDAETHLLADQLGLSVQAINYRMTKTKWGHCTSKGVIQYNWLIMMAPKNIIDYLVAHEVCHLIHPNHSADFWYEVSKIAPNYKEERHWLRENGHKLIL